MRSIFTIANSVEKNLLLTLLALLAFGAPVTAQTQKRPAPLSQQELKAHQYVLQNTALRLPHKLNLGHDDQYQFVLSTLRLAGESPRKSPQLYRNLAAAHRTMKAGPLALAEGVSDAAGTPVSLNLLEYLYNNNQTASSAMYSSIVNGADSTLMMVNYRTTSNPNPFSSSQAFPAYNSQTLNFEQAYAAPIPTSAQNSTVIASALFLVSQGNTTNSYTMAIDDSPPNATSHCVLAPNYGLSQGPTTPCPCAAPNSCPSGGTKCINLGAVTTPIISCYGRSGTSTAPCNYQWGGSGYPSVIPLSVCGSMVFPYPLATPLSGTLLMDLQLGNGGCFLYQAGSAGGSSPLPTQNFWIDPANPNQLNYCFQASQFQNNNCLTQVTQLVNLDMTVYVPLQVGGAGSNWGMGKISSNTVLNPSQPWYALIPQINVLQGCLAAGTRILMADGSWKAVETFKGDGTEVVISGSKGEKKTVTGNVSGPEKKPMYEVTDSAGNKLLLTEMHPVPTSAGVTLAFRLKVGDTLTTPKGPSKIRRIRKIMYKDKVWNLALDDRDSAARGENTLFANGVLVGDLYMQYHFSAPTKKAGLTKQEVLNRLPKSWHQDYLNHLKQ